MVLLLILVAATVASAVAFAPPSLPKLVLLDRDGVINEDVGAPGVVCKTQFELTPGAGKAIGILKRLGCNVVVITNQSCVGKKLLTLSELDEIHKEMQKRLLQTDGCAVIDQIYVCTSVDENDPRKKPNPGMMIEACQDWGVDAAESVFVGDTLTDMQAASAAGMSTRILVETGYGFGLMGSQSAPSPPQLIEKTRIQTKNSDLSMVTPFLYSTNLAEAVNWLVGNC
mmetsp:Transcript_13184/g.17254  ORF Transcript_13184/g.17254 Transcript_13184/m.17254 type:complete len:227 (-) Transcript_13184:36-716(-)